MKRNIAILAILAVLGAWSCSSLDPISPGSVNTGSLSFARFHTVGNSLTAGVQSGGLVTAFQKTSYAAMIAAAAQAPSFEMPLVSEPGNPRTWFVSSYAPVTIDTLPPPDGLPTNLTYPGIYHNLGIPGATLHDLLVVRPAPGTPFGLVLRDTAAFGPTAVDQAVNAQPTFLTAWVGSNDVLGSASVGTDQLLTPPSLFESDYRTMMDRFVAAAGAVVAANIPPVPAIPFFTTIPPIVVDSLTREPVLDQGGNFIPLIGVVQGVSGPLPLNALVTLAAASLLAQGIGVPVAVGGTGQPLPDAVIVDPTELGSLNAAVGDYNTIIDTVCANRGVPVVNVFALFTDIAANGVEIHGEGNLFTTEYLTGGLFSVDGVHPSSLGQWVIAREFVRVLNANFGAAIPQPRLPVGPLRNPGLGQGSGLAAAASISMEQWQGLWRLLGIDVGEALER